MSLFAVVCVDDNWGIGYNGDQPIVLHADRQFFRSITSQCPVLMGYATLLALPHSQPLPGRHNIIITHKHVNVNGAEVVNSIGSAIDSASRWPSCAVIGGASIYEQLLPYCECVYVTKVYTQTVCDRFFPNLEASTDWVLAETTLSGTESGIYYEVRKYVRNTNY